MDTYIKGQVVVCKDVIGLPIVRVVWDSNDSLVFIHTREQFDLRMSGEAHLEPVGFPKEDVFVMDEDVLADAKRSGELPWPRLAVYNGGL
jgi:hypothetical protein